MPRRELLDFYLNRSRSMSNRITAVITQERLSLLIAAIYLLLPLFAAQGSTKRVLAALLGTAGFLLLPLACIWFADELGDYIGILPGPGISKRTPGWMVRLGGWFLLLLPPVAFRISLSN